MKYAIGIDVGGTHIKGGLVSEDGKILKKSLLPSQANQERKKTLKNIFLVISDVFDEKATGIGIGHPAPIDYKKGIILNTPNLPNMRYVPIKSLVEKKFFLPVFLDNDANSFTLGEAIYGAGKNYENVVGLTIGTGIGGGIVINKKIYHGRQNAGELGHMTIDFNGTESEYGNKGDFEEYVSARGIIYLAFQKGLKIKSPHELYILAKKGDKKALEVWEEVGFYIGISLTNVIMSLDPDIVVIGGSIAGSWDFFCKKMKQILNERCLFKPCRVVKRRLHNQAGILGAARLVFEKIR